MEWRLSSVLQNKFEVNENSEVRKVGTDWVYKNIRNKRNGYWYVTVWIDKKGYCKRVHRLSAIEFVDNPLSLSDVNHKDGDKSNNHISNLEWMTRSQNRRHYLAMNGIVNKSSDTMYKKGDPIGWRQVIISHEKGGDPLIANSIREAARIIGVNYKTVHVAIKMGRKSKGYSFGFGDFALSKNNSS